MFLIQLIVAILLIYLWFKFKDIIIGKLDDVKGSWGNQETDRTLNYIYGATFLKLTTDDRIIFRDHIESFYDSVKKRKLEGAYLNEIADLFTTYKQHQSQPSQEAVDTMAKVFGLFRDALKAAPGSYTKDITVKHTYLFFKNKI